MSKRWDKALQRFLDSANDTMEATESHEDCDEFGSVCLTMAANNAVGAARSAPVTPDPEAKAAWLRACEQAWEKACLHADEVDAEETAEVRQVMAAVTATGGDA
jgi:predicted phosphoadenosine phosphosulfate sulfurtransferase